MSTKTYPRWPLAFIGAPAGVAVWSGWVGLGGMCGFGVIHPLPGIADGFTLNTAITLPIGVEAYGAYALGAWLWPGTSDRARKFARTSALAAFALGMLGQVIYHLLAAAHYARAPWPVTMFVACLPVAAMAAGAALAHLMRDEVTMPAVEAVRETVADAVSTVPVTVPETVSAVLETVPVIPPSAVLVLGPDDVHGARMTGTQETVPGAAPENAFSHGTAGNVGVVPAITPSGTVRSVSGRRGRKRARTGRANTPEKVFSAEIERGDVPSLREVMRRMQVGAPKARAILAELQIQDASTGKAAVL